MITLGSVSTVTQSLFLNTNAWDYYKLATNHQRLSDVQNPGDELVTEPIVLL